MAVAQPVSLSVLTPLQVITHFDADNWEAFVREALSASVPPYIRVESKGGGGDKGRDVVAHYHPSVGSNLLDIYQCKAYNKSLAFDDLATELGKLCVFTHEGVYPVPRQYRFVAPLDVTTMCGDILDNPDEIRKRLMDSWATKCESKISKSRTLPLSGNLKTYVEQFDFSIVHYRPASELLDLHQKTPHFRVRFKREYPTRGKAESPPPEPQSNEMRYVNQLLEAYGQHTGSTLANIGELSAHPNLSEHFKGCRKDFFMADGLNRFYRDAQFPGAFEHIKKQVEDGIRNTVFKPQPNGFVRVCEVLEQAAVLTLAQTEYDYCVEVGDKQGICHHLANDDKVKWVQP